MISAVEEEEEEEAHVSAVELLNPSHDEEETDEQDIIILRDKPRRQPSLRENLTNSLSRIGNRMRREKPPKLRRLQSTLDFDRLAKNELELKANLYWHIATPIKRWKVEGQVPIKLVLQLLKTLCLIVQVGVIMPPLKLFIQYHCGTVDHSHSHYNMYTDTLQY